MFVFSLHVLAFVDRKKNGNIVVPDRFYVLIAVHGVPRLTFREASTNVTWYTIHISVAEAMTSRVLVSRVSDKLSFLIPCRSA